MMKYTYSRLFLSMSISSDTLCVLCWTFSFLTLYLAIFVTLLFTDACAKWNRQTGLLFGIHGILLFLNIWSLRLWEGGTYLLLHDTYDL
jgi:hypothetical protein